MSEIATRPSLKQWLQTQDYGWPVHVFVGRMGIQCKAQPLPAEYKRGIPKQCFSNATSIALDNPSLRYVEGFAVRVIPIHHAWLIDEAGNVIDPTWDRPEEGEYCGVVFDTDTLRRELLKLKYYGILEGPRGVNFDLMKRLDPGLDEALRHLRAASPFYSKLEAFEHG
jgi:hypothetical protein